MPPCVIRTKEGVGPWTPCPQPALMVDSDGDALCAAHLEQLWSCPECGGVIAAGNATLCPTCQAEADALDTESLP
jgi:hypothetical protein